MMWYNFHPHEVVDRVSETQLQVSKNLNWIIWQLKGLKTIVVALSAEQDERVNHNRILFLDQGSLSDLNVTLAPRIRYGVCHL